MYKYFHIRDKNNILWRIEINEELQKLEIYAEDKIPHKDFSQIMCRTSNHVVHLDKDGISVFNLDKVKKS